MHHPLIALLSLLLLAVGCGDSAGPLAADRAAAGQNQGGAAGSVDGDRCSGVVVGGTYETIKVSSGSTCTLRGVVVSGNVIALQNARVFVEESRVEGNVQGENAAVVHVRGGRIGGNLQIHEGAAPGELVVSVTGGTVLPEGNIQVTKMRGAEIVIADAVLGKGNLQVEENIVTGALDVVRNHVAQNLEVRKNRGGGAKTVRDNTVRQKLECKENNAPFAGTPNSAAEAEGQCR